MLNNILSRNMVKDDVHVTTSFPYRNSRSDINKVLSSGNNNSKEGRSLLIVQPRHNVMQEKQVTSEAESESASASEPVQNKNTNDNNNKTPILPVLNPEFNVREIVKNSILLEDHLNHPGKQCGDCIMKHMLALESYADELLSLTPQSDQIDYSYLKTLPSVFRGLQEDWYTSRRPFHEIAQDLRKIRKKFMSVSFPVVFQNKEKKCQTCSL